MAESEAVSAIANLKKVRTSLKVKLTSTTTQLCKCSPLDRKLLDDLYAKVNSIYADLCDAHYEYAELVADSDYDSHRVVNGLDVTQYYESFTETHAKALDTYTHHKAAFIGHEIQLALGQIAKLDELGDAVDKSRITTFIEHLSMLSAQYHSIHNDTNSELESAIVYLGKVQGGILQQTYW